MNDRKLQIDIAIITMNSLAEAMEVSIGISDDEDRISIPRSGAEAMVVFFKDMTKFLLEIKDGK